MLTCVRSGNHCHQAAVLEEEEDGPSGGRAQGAHTPGGSRSHVAFTPEGGEVLHAGSDRRTMPGDHKTVETEFRCL